MTRFLLNYVYRRQHWAYNLWCYTRAWQVVNLVTHGITDKAPYLSEEITLRLLFLLFPCTIDH